MNIIYKYKQGLEQKLHRDYWWQRIVQSESRTLSLWGLVFAFIFFNTLALKARAGDSIRVTIHQGTNMAIALSPDKEIIAMDLQGTIWTMPVNGGKAVAITDALSDNRQPVWSPDGSRLAFQSYRSGEYHIWVINRNGTALKQITSGVYDDREPHWSPDGLSVVFSSDRSGNYDIWKVEIASGKLTQLTTNGENDFCPAWAPDGNRIAFISDRKAAAGIYMIDENGKEQLLLRSASRIASPAWSPDGSMILYIEQASGQSLLKALQLSDNSQVNLSDLKEDVFPFRVSWASADTFLYTSDGVIKRASTTQKGTTVISFEASVFLDRTPYKHKTYNFSAKEAQQVKGIRSPKISPDGTKIAFTALSNLWLLTKGSQDPVQITHDAFIEVDPSWSPDGSAIVYTSDANGNMDMWTYDVKTGKTQCILNLTDVIKYPAWSPDGNTIAFYQAGAGGRGQAELNLLNVKTKKVSKLYEGIADGGSPSWSPNGKHIVLSAEDSYSSRFREGINKILNISLTGSPVSYFSPVADVSLGTRGVNGPVWSPDGSMMAFILNGVLWTVPVDSAGTLTGAPKQVTSELAEAPGWTADSKSIFYLATDTLKQVFLQDGRTEVVPMTFTWKYKAPTGEFVIHAGKLFDGRSSTYKTNVDIVVKGDRIAAIEPHKSTRTGTVIDASAKTVIPGLFEMHTHQNDVLGEQMGRLWLSYGITSIREPGTDPYDALERKEAWASGARIGPRTFIAGAHMEGNRVYYNRNLSTPTEKALELELQRAVRLGYDMIKTYVRMPDDVQQRIISYAHAHGIPVSSHEIYPATRNGIDGMEHMGASSRRGYSPKLTALNFSYHDVTELIIKSGITFTPTASLHGGLSKLALSDSGFFRHRQFAAFYPAAMQSNLKSGASQTVKSNPDAVAQLSNILQTMRRVLAGGGRVTPGTDSPIIPSGLSLYAELQTWTNGGISPFETLRAATLWSAEATGVGKDLGTIEPGKLADMVIVDGDPLTNIRDVLNIDMVFKNAIKYSIDELLNGAGNNGK